MSVLFEDIIILVYVDDLIIVSKSEGIILSLIKWLHEGEEIFEFTDEEDIKIT